MRGSVAVTDWIPWVERISESERHASRSSSTISTVKAIRGMIPLAAGDGLRPRSPAKGAQGRPQSGRASLSRRISQMIRRSAQQVQMFKREQTELVGGEAEPVYDGGDERGAFRFHLADRAWMRWRAPGESPDLWCG